MSETRQLWPVALLLDGLTCTHVCTKHHLSRWHLSGLVFFPHQSLSPATPFQNRCWFCSPQLCANTETQQKPKGSRMYLHRRYRLWLAQHSPTPNSTELFTAGTGMLWSGPGERISETAWAVLKRHCTSGIRDGQWSTRGAGTLLLCLLALAVHVVSLIKLLILILQRSQLMQHSFTR